MSSKKKDSTEKKDGVICYFCEESARSDNLRKHCKAKHACSDIVDKVLVNGLRFRRDVDRPNLLISLKTEGSKDNCGYCFDCHTRIPMPSGQCTNKVAYIQRHQCRVVKERKKRVVTDPVPSGKFVAPVAPTGKRTEEDLKAFSNVFRGLKDPMREIYDLVVPVYNDDYSIDFKHSDVNILKGVTMMAERIKADYALKSSTTTTNAFSVEQVIDEYCMDRNSKKQASRGVKLRESYNQHHDSAKAEAEDGDEDSVYIKPQEDKAWLFDRLDVSVIGIKAEAPKGDPDTEEELRQAKMAITDLKQQLLRYKQNAEGESRDNAELREQNQKYEARYKHDQEQLRLLKEQLTEQADTITHTTDCSKE